MKNNKLSVFKKVFLLLPTLSMFLCGCSNKTTKTGFVSGEVTGSLIHLRFWDTHDKWVLDGLTITLKFEDNTTIYTDFKDKAISYRIEPEAPCAGIDRIYIQDIYYTDGAKQKNRIPNAEVGVRIIKFPYEIANTQTDNKIPVWFVVPFAIVSSSLVVSFVFIQIAWNKKRGKGDE